MNEAIKEGREILSRKLTLKSKSNYDRSKLPSNHEDHICGMYCDGQDGINSECAKIRRGDVKTTN